MKAFTIGGCTVIGILALGAPLFGQTVTPNFSQTVTTGVLSLSLNQSAQLNVLNLNPVPATANAVAPVCTVELELRDAQNNLLKQLLVSNIAPGNAVSLTLRRSEVPKVTASHMDIRGVVRTGPLTPSASAIVTPIANSGCTVMTTLEISNDITGDTQVVTSDTRSTATPLPTPVTK